MKFTKGELLAKARAEAEAKGEAIKWVNYTDNIEGWIDCQVDGQGDHMTTRFLVVFERDGQTWGFYEHSTDKGGSDFTYDYGDDSAIECFPVEEVTTVRWKRADVAGS